MADAPVLGGSKKVKLDDAVFGVPFNGPLVHESVRAELNARRQGTHATKTRGLVRGGGAKPWRQKGTGRARAGSSRSPVWIGGGTVFGPSPRHYTFKVNRKERIAALRSALSVHADRGSIAVLDPAPFEAPSTKQAKALLAGWQDVPSVLVVIEDLDADARETDAGRAALSFRNIDRVSVAEASTVGVADIIGAGGLLITEAALEAITARAARKTKKEATA